MGTKWSQNKINEIRTKAKLYYDNRGRAGAFDLFLELAEQGDPESQCYLGEYYKGYTGVVEEDYEKSIEWYSKAADQGYAKAQYELGMCYKEGWGVSPDLDKAFILFKKSADQGYGFAQGELSSFYEYGIKVDVDIKEHLKWARRCASNHGFDVDVNDFKEYLFNAIHGDRDAQFCVGDCYLIGMGVEVDEIEAVRWYRRSAENNFHWAALKLALCYKTGIGVDSNEKEAGKWLIIALKQKNYVAKKVFANWYLIPAEHGDVKAQCKLGYFYKNGIGVEENPDEAVKWYRMAAKQGNSLAQCQLGECYQIGSGVEASVENAISLYRKAADNGEVRAYYNIGMCYLFGEGFNENPVKAVEWFRRAAEKGDAKAQCQLGWCYHTGEGVLKDTTEAVKWYKKAISQGNLEARRYISYISNVVNEEERERGALSEFSF